MISNCAREVLAIRSQYQRVIAALQESVNAKAKKAAKARKKNKAQKAARKVNR